MSAPPTFPQMMASSLDLLTAEDTEINFNLIEEIATAQVKNSYYWPELKKILVSKLETVITIIWPLEIV